MKSGFITCMIATALFMASTAFAQTPPQQIPAAPAAPQKTPDWASYKNPYAGEESNIANPHRTADEIMIWTQQTASDVLSFGKADYKERINGFKKYFLPQGWQMYATYLKDSRILDMVVNGGYSASAIVNDSPEIISQSDIDGVYHWTVKVPFIVSFANNGTRADASGKYILFMDMQRVENGGDNGIAIGSWRVENLTKP